MSPHFNYLFKTANFSFALNYGYLKYQRNKSKMAYKKISKIASNWSVDSVILKIEMELSLSYV